MAAEQERPITDPKSGYCEDSGIYYSKRDPIDLPPPTQHLDVTTYIFFHHDHTQEIALIDASSDLWLSYTALRQNVKALAAGMHGLGIRKGDVVLLYPPIPSLFHAFTSPFSPLEQSCALPIR